MAYTIKQFHQDYVLPTYTPEERMRGLKPEERLKGLSIEERLKGLSIEERLIGLSAEDRRKILNPSVLIKHLMEQVGQDDLSPELRAMLAHFLNKSKEDH